MYIYINIYIYIYIYIYISIYNIEHKYKIIQQHFCSSDMFGAYY